MSEARRTAQGYAWPIKQNGQTVAEVIGGTKYCPPSHYGIYCHASEMEDAILCAKVLLNAGRADDAAYALHACTELLSGESTLSEFKAALQQVRQAAERGNDA